MSVFTWLFGERRVEVKQEHKPTYAQRFSESTQNFLEKMRGYVKGESGTLPEPFETLVVNSQNRNPALFEGLDSVGQAPWYFIGPPEFIDKIEAVLKSRADELQTAIMFARGQLTCLQRKDNKYVTCSLEDYVRQGEPVKGYKLNALPPATAYVVYNPLQKAA